MALKSRPRERKPDLTVRELLETSTNKPDPPKRRRRLQGSKTKMSIGVFMFELFEANERAERKAKKTNAGLAEIIKKEFPKNYKLHIALNSGVEKNGINMYRQRYNVGRLVPGRPVLYISYRYDEHGDRVNFRNPSKRLTAREVKEVGDRYRTKLQQAYDKLIDEGKSNNG